MQYVDDFFNVQLLDFVIYSKFRQVIECINHDKAGHCFELHMRLHQKAVQREVSKDSKLKKMSMTLAAVETTTADFGESKSAVVISTAVNSS